MVSNYLSCLGMNGGVALSSVYAEVVVPKVTVFGDRIFSR